MPAIQNTRSAFEVIAIYLEREREIPPIIAQILVRKCKKETCVSVKVTYRGRE